MLIAHGENDWIMAPDEHLRIRDLIGDPSRVTVIARPRTDHHFAVFTSQADAFAERGRPDSTVIDDILEWVARLRRHS